MTRRENIIVLGGGLEHRTNLKTGKERFSVQLKSDPITINLDPKTLGKPVAEAIAHHLRERVRGISERASPATLRARAVAAKAFAAGEAWALKRYAGGKMGGRAPNQSDRSFNDSGRFAESIAVGASKDDSWRINVAANRLSSATATGGAAGVQRIWEKLVSLVPEFADMGKLMAASDVVRARVKAQERMFRKGTLKEVVGLVNDLIDTARNVGGLFGA